MGRIVVWGMAFLLTGYGGMSAAQQDNRGSGGKILVPTTRNDSASSTADKTVPKDQVKNPVYVIGPEDVLDVTVWKEPDVSRVVPVRPDGRISLPLIHDIQAAGLSPEQLASTVAERLHKYLNDPKVTVIVTAINSQRVFVVGEVLRAGAFPLIPGMTVLQALSSAGGFTTFANVKKIHVVRVRDGKQMELDFNYREVLRGDSSEQNITLEPGDTVMVP